ncbi:prolipoprotein diacylglyceryl transferase [Rossellomorea sp. YZS02]|uniref:prolipoprotein diacylglyceryl transferase n=1 Tax=Rossellomorea sp. YZS02 TaxID=3097358 RepID=UPI002A0B7752|nr:prolipoprotein diacylglyceryl transferase [Rossellomorea sp. YZS02]MDX8345200.1 prolipoprotein diacylglyceryl transferase [Rossellomorea sp. YZS02]
MEDINTIDRIAIEAGPFTVYWYGVIIGLGILIGFLLATKESRKTGLDHDVFPDLLIWAIPTSILFARIYYVSFEWEYYKENPLNIIAVWEGGIAIHGALIGAVLTTIIYCYKKGISFWKVTDIAAPSLILAQSIGRWGNFINQEAHGTQVSGEFLESMFLPDFIVDQMFIEGNYYHPTFLYESMWNLLGFIVLITIRRKFTKLKQGDVFLTYLIWYSTGRFFVEGMRTDSLMLTDSIRVAQLISLLIIGIAIFLMYYRRKKYRLEPYLHSYRRH